MTSAIPSIIISTSQAEFEEKMTAQNFHKEVKSKL
jgi:hypothetical protein